MNNETDLAEDLINPRVFLCVLPDLGIAGLETTLAQTYSILTFARRAA